MGRDGATVHERRLLLENGMVEEVVVIGEYLFEGERHAGEQGLGSNDCCRMLGMRWRRALGEVRRF